MKHYLTFLVLSLLVLQGTAQNVPVETKIKLLEKRIEQTEADEQLKWLDSLTSLTLKDDQYAYDEIASKAIKQAVLLDSSRIIAKQIADLIYRKTNVDGVPGKGLDVFYKHAPSLKEDTSAKWLAKVFIEHGFSHFISGNIDSSFYYYKKGAANAALSKDEYLLADAKVCLGEAYAKQGDFSDASQNLQEAAVTFRALKDTSKLLYVKKNITLLYKQSGFYEEAQKEFEEAIALSKATKEYRRTAVFTFFSALEYQRKGLEKERILALNEAINYSYKSKYDLFNRIRFLSALSIAYSENDSITQAQNVLQKIEAEQNLTPKEYNLRNRIYYVDALKKLARAKGNIEEALAYGEESFRINTERKAFEETQEAAFFLSKIYDEIGDKEKALTHFRIHTKIKDSITGIQKTRALAYYQTLYETEKRDQKILAQNTSITLLEQEGRIRNQWILIGAILAGVLFFVFYYRNRYKQKMEKRIVVEQLRTKISADLHDDVGSLLTGLAMQSEILGNNAPTEIKNKLSRVSSLSRAAMLKMRDAVWVMDARKDNWQSLIDRIQEFASENFGTKNLRYNLRHENTSNKEEIEGVVRQHLYLISKEGITNILKHSNADTVDLYLSKKKDEVVLSIKDNGVVTSEQGNAGLGLSNIKKRVEDLQGKLRIDTEDGYALTIKIPA